MKKILLGTMLLLMLTGQAAALEIYLENGDRITGTIVEETDGFIVVRSSGIESRIDKGLIDRQKTYPEEYGASQPGAEESETEPGVEWKKTLALGYTHAGGNTVQRQGSLTSQINRKTETNEATARLDAFYSSTDKVIDTKKFYSLLRYAYSFGRDRQWYDFVKLEGDQDRTANIDYRVIPSAGRGYWFSNTDDWKAMAEMAAGYQYTNYRTGAESEGEGVLIPRFFLDKRLIEKLHLSEDFTLYPSLGDFGEYRWRSETALTNQINERWALKTQFIDEYNSDPQTAVKKHDYRWITSVNYAF